MKYLFTIIYNKLKVNALCDICLHKLTNSIIVNSNELEYMLAY